MTQLWREAALSPVALSSLPQPSAGQGADRAGADREGPLPAPGSSLGCASPGQGSEGCAVCMAEAGQGTQQGGREKGREGHEGSLWCEGRR